MATDRIHERAQGRWPGILMHLKFELSESMLRKGRHGPCPICRAGTDRFRFDDRGGRGTWICSHCGSGSGVDLVMKAKGVQFAEAKRMIEEVVGKASFEAPRVKREVDPARHMQQWQRANPLSGSDPASLYLRNRGLALRTMPACIRWVSNARWYPDPGKRNEYSEHPAMLGLFVSPDRQTSIIHRTYLTLEGTKANLGQDEKGLPHKVKKFAPGKIPTGGAVRLAPSAETMGIAEGIEKALAAAELHGLPVWAACGGDNLMKWVPPENVKYVIVYGDNDVSFAGQYKANGLAYRLKAMGLTVEVQLPPEQGEDWSDVLVSVSGEQRLVA